jgi:hypothetical protein
MAIQMIIMNRGKIHQNPLPPLHMCQGPEQSHEGCCANASKGSNKAKKATVRKAVRFVSISISFLGYRSLPVYVKGRRNTGSMWNGYAERKGSADAAGGRRKPLVARYRSNVVIGSSYPELTCKGKHDQGRTTGNEPAKGSEQSGTEAPPVFRVQSLEEFWGASVATEYKQSHRCEDEHEKKEQRNRIASHAYQEVSFVEEKSDRHSRRSPNPCNGGSGWGRFNVHCVANESVEKASSDIALVMPVLQDRGIGNLWESMPGWPATRESIPVRIHALRFFPPVATRHLRKRKFQ